MKKVVNGRTFIVDAGETMVNSANLDSKNDKQKLYCKCGATKVYNSKIMRNVVKNYDELIEDSESVESVACDDCKTVYDNNNKVCLLSPEKEELYHIRYSFEKKGKKLILNKNKSFVTYRAVKDELSFREVVDSIVVDTAKSYEATINLNPPHDNAESMVSSSFSELGIDGTKSYSKVVDLTNISVFEEFFNYIEFINYEGLDESFNFIKSIDNQIKDLEELKGIPFLGFLYANSDIKKEKTEDGDFKYYQLVESGFGDGNTVKTKLVFGDYLKNLEDVCELFFSITSYPSISTVLLTKGYDFFDKLVHSSSHIFTPAIYEKENATSPHKIVEISLNKNKEGKLKATEIEEHAENKGYLKVSGTLYSNIGSPTEMDILLDVYTGGYLTKSQMESLFQTYDNQRLYKLFKQLTKSRRMEVNLQIRHIEHILKNGIDEGKSDFLNTYADTLRTVDLLDLKDKYVFKCKDFEALREMHDDLSARYNAIKDEKKAEIYIKSVEPFIKLNCMIGDVLIEVVPTTEKLSLEGLQVNHCIYTYLNRVCDRKYIAINATHTLSKEKATAGFNRNGEKLEMDQLKGFYNSRATAEMINTVVEFCKKNKISTRNAYDLSPDTSREREMPGQLNQKDLKALREKMKKEEEKKSKKEKKKGNKTEEKEGVTVIASATNVAGDNIDADTTTKDSEKSKSWFGGMFK